MSGNWRNPWCWLLVAVLAVSAGLRAHLVSQGGQFFWPDETRYYVSRDAVAALAEHHFAAAAKAILGGADHLFFKVLGMVPAGIERLAGYDGTRVAAGFFAGFSVLNILLVCAIARAAGAGWREAVTAAVLMAGAVTQFYYGRHFFPYDAALSFGLLALWVGWRRSAGAGRSLGCGVLAGLGFLTYNGNWLFGAMVLAGHVVLAGADWRGLLRRAAWAGAGLVLPIGLTILLARRLADTDLVAAYLSFSRSITQGDFGGGWKVVRDYFWSAEGLNALLGVAGLLAIIAGAVAARVGPPRVAANATAAWQRGLGWVAGVGFLLAGLLFFSDWAHQFVIYGRTARVVVPLVCLAGAFGLERLWLAGGRSAALATGLAALIGLQAVANFWAPWQQQFPLEFNPRALRLREQLRRGGEGRVLTVLYADVVTVATLLDRLPDHEVLLATPHPLQYRPYLFEGFPEAQRTALEQADIRMRLIAINAARADIAMNLRRPYPGVIRLTLRLPKIPGPVPEPLIVTGVAGKGDMIYVVYDSPTTIRLGHDHWGIGATVSEPLPVDYDRPVTLTVSMGPLHAPVPAGENPPSPDLTHWLHLELDGRQVWSRPAEFHAALPASISLGENYIGGSTCGIRFTGRILRAESLLDPVIPPAGR